MIPDDLVAFDDRLREALTRCTLCGVPCPRTAYTGVWEQGAPPHHRLAYLVCLRCHSQPTWSATLLALLADRYARGDNA
jgi:hypothetical protein